MSRCIKPKLFTNQTPHSLSFFSHLFWRWRQTT